MYLLDFNKTLTLLNINCKLSSYLELFPNNPTEKFFMKEKALPDFSEPARLLL